MELEVIRANQRSGSPLKFGTGDYVSLMSEKQWKIAVAISSSPSPLETAPLIKITKVIGHQCRCHNKDCQVLEVELPVPILSEEDYRRFSAKCELVGFNYTLDFEKPLQLLLGRTNKGSGHETAK